MQRKYEQIREILEQAGGRIVMVTFRKKDGSLRKMNVQPAAAKYRIKGDAANESARKGAETRAKRYPNLLNVWDADRKAFRSINMDTVTRIAANGRVFTWEEN